MAHPAAVVLWRLLREHDHPAWGGPVAPVEFDAKLMARTFAACRMTHHGAAEEAGLRVQEVPDGWRLL